MIAEITDSPLGLDAFDEMLSAVMQANKEYWRAQLKAMDEKLIKAALGKESQDPS